GAARRRARGRGGRGRDGRRRPDRLRTGSFDCALVDYDLPDGEGLGVLAGAAEPVPTVMLTGQGDERLAVDLMKRGARDYIPKAALGPGRLARSVRHAVEMS